VTRREVLRVVMAMPAARSALRVGAAVAAEADTVRAAVPEPFVDHGGWIVPASDRDALIAATGSRF